MPVSNHFFVLDWVPPTVAVNYARVILYDEVSLLDQLSPPVGNLCNVEFCAPSPGMTLSRVRLYGHISVCYVYPVIHDVLIILPVGASNGCYGRCTRWMVFRIFRGLEIGRLRPVG